MKVSRLNINDFSIEDCPPIERNNVGGDDLLIYGGNRSGKTLTFNAVLYGLLGRNATFNVSPGRGADVSIHFDNGDSIQRAREHVYRRNGDELDADTVADTLGNTKLVRLQFLHSNVNQQPLSLLAEGEFLQVIRQFLSNELEEEMNKHIQAKEHIKHRIEMVKRGGGGSHSLDNLKSERDNINLNRMYNRLEDIEHLQSLFDSGEIATIRDRLLEGDEISEEISTLMDKRKELHDTLRQKRGELRETKRYTDEVNDLIIDALEELPCPVCDRLVPESTAEYRLSNNECPHCGQSRGISDVKEDIRERIDIADERLEPLEEEIEALQDEFDQVEERISELREQEPKFSNVSTLVKRALESADYDLEAAEEETQQQLENHEEAIEEEEEKLEELEELIAEREARISNLMGSAREANGRVQILSRESFQNDITTFKDRWTINYQNMAPDLASEIEIDPDGSIRIPGTQEQGLRSYDILSSGEKRLLNISFAFTLAELAQESEDTPQDWEVLVMDEPLTNVEDDIQETAVSYLLESDIQCIFTTSNDRIKSMVHPSKVSSLDPITILTTLDQFA